MVWDGKSWFGEAGKGWQGLARWLWWGKAGVVRMGKDRKGWVWEGEAGVVRLSGVGCGEEGMAGEVRHGASRLVVVQ